MQKAAMLIVLIAFSVFLVSLAHGEQTGSVNLTSVKNTFVTGLQGNVVDYCNTTAHCLDSTNYKCFVDYDAQSINGSYTGWCAAVSKTSCSRNNAASASYENTTTGSNYCVNSTAYRSCSNGNWSVNATLCSSGETCSDGACSSSSSSGSGGSGSSSSSNASGSFIVITSYPSAFNLTQGDNISKTVSITNGNSTQRNITLAISGINLAWFVVSPDKIAVMSAKANGSFMINFSVPSDAEVKAYTITATASTSNASIIGTENFTLTVLPSNKTVEEQIKPSLNAYTEQLAALETRLAQEKTNFTQAKVAKIQNLIDFARTKLEHARKLLDEGKYFDSNTEIEEVKGLISDIKAAFDQKDDQNQPVVQTDDLTFIIALVVIVAAASAVVAFFMWPTKEAGYSKEGGWLHTEEKKSLSDRLKKKFKKKKAGESYFYEPKQGK